MATRLSREVLVRIPPANHVFHHVEVGLMPVDLSFFFLVHVATYGFGAWQVPRVGKQALAQPFWRKLERITSTVPRPGTEGFRATPTASRPGSRRCGSLRAAGRPPNRASS